jgi:hypothetical protein
VNVGFARLDHPEPRGLELQLGLELLRPRHVHDQGIDTANERPIAPDLLDQPQDSPRRGLLA